MSIYPGIKEKLARVRSVAIGQSPEHAKRDILSYGLSGALKEYTKRRVAGFGIGAGITLLMLPVGIGILITEAVKAHFEKRRYENIMDSLNLDERLLADQSINFHRARNTINFKENLYTLGQSKKDIEEYIDPKLLNLINSEGIDLNHVRNYVSRTQLGIPYSDNAIQKQLVENDRFENAVISYYGVGTEWTKYQEEKAAICSGDYT